MESPARARLEELYGRLAAFFQRVDAAAPGAMACRAGCSDCCGESFSVTAVEAAAVADALAALPSDRRLAVAGRVGAGPCTALDPDGRCAVYEGRPAICRTHGLPIRFATASEERREGPDPPDARRRLPVIDACPKNFVGRDLDELDRSWVLDQVTVSTILAAIDAAWASERGEGVARARVALDDVLRG